MSAEPDWAEWAQTLAGVLELVTRDIGTREDRDTAQAALAHFDRRCREWWDRVAGVDAGNPGPMSQ